MKPIYAWVGVTDGNMEVELFPQVADDGYCRVYRTKAAAQKAYESVVKVMIVAISDIDDPGKS